ncbi:hypothetical protein BGZ76_005547 [Entomortierella beljakovae]|nr:hypothetical protein BGZ76_005547 [Entomortierella beljakovae]
MLLDRLCSYERDSDSSPDSLSPISSDSEISDSSLNSYLRSRRTSPSERAVATAAKKNQNLKVPAAVAKNPEPSTSAPPTTHHPKKTTNKTTPARKSPAVPTRKEEKQVSVPSTITTVGSATQKPKRIHNTSKLRPTLSSKVRKVQAIDRDEAGNVKLPVTVGIITIMSLGHVEYEREAFHNERYIWPIGYKMSRLYNSMIHPQAQTTYTCSVIDDGDAPKFQIDAGDQPGNPIIAGTATGAWTHVVKTANQIRKRDHSNSASGPDYFGFSNATIAKMIQDLPNTDKCKTYIMQRYEEPLARPSQNNAKTDKRKTSAVDSNVNGKDGNAADNEGGDDEQTDDADGADGEEEDSLETPARKKMKRSSASPKGPPSEFDTEGVEEKEGGVEEEHDELEGEEEEEEEVDELEGDDTLSEKENDEIAELPKPSNSSNSIEQPSSHQEDSSHSISTSTAAPVAEAPPIVIASDKSSSLETTTTASNVAEESNSMEIDPAVPVESNVAQ